MNHRILPVIALLVALQAPCRGQSNNPAPPLGPPNTGSFWGDLWSSAKRTEYFGGYGVLVHNTHFKDNERGAVTGIQGDIPTLDVTFKTGNQLHAGPVTGVMVEKTTNRILIGFGASTDWFHWPSIIQKPLNWIQGKKDVTPVVNVVPGQIAKLHLQAAAMTTSEFHGIGAEGSCAIPF